MPAGSNLLLCAAPLRSVEPKLRLLARAVLIHCPFSLRSARQIFNCQRSELLTSENLAALNECRSYYSMNGIDSKLQVVGLGRLELPTSPLSGVRSSHLSYRPISVLLLVELVGIEPATS
jgi:hypothetical protein